MTIRVKLFIAILSIVIFSTVVLGGFALVSSTNGILTFTRSSMMDSNKDNSANIRSAINKEIRNAALISQYPEVEEILLNAHKGEAVKEKLQSGLSSKFQQIVKDSGNLEHVFIADLNGTDLADSDTNLYGQSFSEREYAKRLFAGGNPVISEIIKSKSTGAYVVAFVYPVKVNGELLGFVATAVHADSMIKYLPDFKLLDTKLSYAYLVDEKGNMIYHPDKDKIGKPVENTQIKAIVEKVKKGEKVDPDIVDYDYRGQKKESSYSIIPETNWTLVISGDIGEIMMPISKMKSNIIIIGLISIAVALIMGFFIARMISAPILKLTELVNNTADLNLVYDERFFYLGENKDETGTIAIAVIQTRKVLREMAGKLISVSQIAMENAEQMKKLSINIQESAQNNSATTEQLSAGMQETAASAEEITATVAEIDSSVCTIAERAKDGAEVSDKIMQRAVLLKQDTVESRQRTGSIYGEVKVKMERAIEESGAITQIGVLADTILSITSQTNLLALNAAIEAARAGEPEGDLQ